MRRNNNELRLWQNSCHSAVHLLPCKGDNLKKLNINLSLLVFDHILINEQRHPFLSPPSSREEVVNTECDWFITLSFLSEGTAHTWVEPAAVSVRAVWHQGWKTQTEHERSRYDLYVWWNLTANLDILEALSCFKEVPGKTECVSEKRKLSLDLSFQSSQYQIVSDIS